MKAKNNVLDTVVVVVPTTVVFVLVNGILENHFPWIVALAIAIVPSALAGWVVRYLYNHKVKKS